VNKMDSEHSKFDALRFKKICEDVRACLVKVGWKKDFVENEVPMIPISGWSGDNVVRLSQEMPWWQGQSVSVDGASVLVHTLQDVVNRVVRTPPRNTTAPLRIPISGVFKIKGVGDVVTGRVECGAVKLGEEVVFAVAGAKATVKSIETHHRGLERAAAGDIIGLSVRGLSRDSMPEIGDVLVASKNARPLKPVRSFKALVAVQRHPGELRVGRYSPLCFVRTARAQVRLESITWKMTSGSGGQKLQAPSFLRSQEYAEVVFAAQDGLAVEAFEDCEGLSRVVLFDSARGEGATAVMLGKVVSTVPQDVAGGKGGGRSVRR